MDLQSGRLLEVNAYSRLGRIKFSTFSASVVCLFCNKTINSKNKRQDVTKQGFYKIRWTKLRLRGSILLVLIQFWGMWGDRMWGGSGRLFEAGRLLTFPAFTMGAYSRLALIRSWALIRINTVPTKIWKQLCLVITNKTFTLLKMERVDDGKAWRSKINISLQEINIW